MSLAEYYIDQYENGGMEDDDFESTLVMDCHYQFTQEDPFKIIYVFKDGSSIEMDSTGFEEGKYFEYHSDEIISIKNSRIDSFDEIGGKIIKNYKSFYSQSGNHHLLIFFSDGKWFSFISECPDCQSSQMELTDDDYYRISDLI